MPEDIFETQDMRRQTMEARLREADDAYYNNDAPIMTDVEYDALAAQYEHYTGQKWMKAGVASPELPHGKHVRPMQSLDKEKTLEGLVKFLGPKTWVLGSPKVDGLGLSLDYNSAGVLVRALTRGDHIEGEDVTEVVKSIPSIPKKLPAPWPKAMTIRGEIYLTEENFSVVGGVNPRNSAAGVLRRKSDVSQAHLLDFVAYKAFATEKKQHEDDTFTHDSSMIGWLFDMGFQVVPTFNAQVENLTLEALKGITVGVPYWTDGAVLTVNEWAHQRSLGLGSKSPRFAVAFKFEQERKTTTLIDIEWNATRTGRVVPTAVFEAVFLDGTTVQRATLHNKKYITDVLGGLCLMDKVAVYKANAIIPQVEKVVERYQGTTKFFLVPETCPACRKPTRTEDVDIRCDNPVCGPKLIGQIVNFGSRKNMDVDGLGEEFVTALVNDGRVQDLVDLVDISAEALADLPFGKGYYGPTRGVKLRKAIDEALKKQPWSVVLHSLGCPGLGEPECEAIAAEYSLEDLLVMLETDGAALERNLIALKGVGPVTASTLCDWLEDNFKWLQTLSTRENIRTQREMPMLPTSTTLAGQTWVITGTLSKPRHIFEALIKEHGGSTSGSVSKKTTALLAGAEAGSKLEKAEKLGIPVYDEAKFQSLLG